MRLTLSALIATALLTVGLLAPAQAASARFTDPAGDGAAGARLDITDGVLRNHDRRIVVETSYARVSRGTLVVFLQSRGQAGVWRIVSQHRPAGQDQTFLLDRTGQRRECARLSVTWDDEADTSRALLPSRCFLGGNDGAVRTTLLTEVDGGSDADFAPNDGPGGLRWTEWTARG
jgi:hypothetical protein